MSGRPVGMYLLCGFFGLLGLGSVASALSVSGLDAEFAAGQPESVQLFVAIYPVFMLLLGLLGLFAAVTLWTARPIGRTSGLAWIGIWIAEELAMGIWVVTGPEIVRQVGDGLWENVVRVGVALVAFYYLWTVGAQYVEVEEHTPSASGRSTDQ